ncbi:MAG: hypothetical protein N2Z62_06685 [Rhodobacteraceae bacterium]|nr:hypothetical protein [Paracoccaceae bacterium]
MTAIRSLALGTALALAPAATVASAQTISDIGVSADFSAAQGANALDFWPDLETDLEARLARELADRMGSDGARLQVIVNDVSVDGSAILTADGAFNSLSGGVFLYPAPEADGTQQTPFTTSVTVVGVPDLPAEIPAGGPTYLILPSDATVYDVMLDRFAEVVSERLPPAM